MATTKSPKLNTVQINSEIIVMFFIIVKNATRSFKIAIIKTFMNQTGFVFISQKFKSPFSLKWQQCNNKIKYMYSVANSRQTEFDKNPDNLHGLKKMNSSDNYYDFTF